MNTRLYFIDNKHRDKIHIDANTIEGVKVRSIDEYLLNFEHTKKLVYEYMKKTQKVVDLSYVHNLFADQDSLNWHKSDDIYNDGVAVNVVKKLVYDPYSWKHGVRTIQNTIFDAKYLLIQDKRRIAKKCTDIYMKAQPTHCLSHRTSLRGFSTMQKHNEFFVKRMEITKKFFENVVLKDVNLPNTIKVNYMFDFIELYDEVTKMTLHHTVREDLDNSIKMIFPRVDGKTRKKSTSNPKSIMSFARKYPDVNQLIDNIDENPNKILEYHQELRLNKEEHENTYAQCVASLEHVLDEFVAQENYLDVNRLGMIFVHANAVESTWFKFIGSRNRMNLYKTTYYPKQYRSTENDEDWLRITQRSQSHMRAESNKIAAQYLIDLGFMNIFYTRREPKLTEYYLLAQDKLSHRYVMSFMMSTSTQGLEILEPYLSVKDELKTEFETMTEANVELVHALPNDPDLNDEKFFSRLEIEYKRNWPHDFELTRKEMISNLKKSSTAFKRKNKKILE